MNGRTIATHGGGDLVIGGGPPIDGVLHCWYYPEGEGHGRGPYGCMLGHREAEQLAAALRSGEEQDVNTFTGRVKVTRNLGVASLWFYAWGETVPDHVCRLFEGAIEVAAEAIGEALNPMVPAPVDVHDQSLSGPARARLEELLEPGLRPAA